MNLRHLLIFKTVVDTGSFTKAAKHEILNECNNIIFSMRGVPSIDDSGIREFIDVVELCRQNNINVLFAGVQKNVMKQFKRHHFVELAQPNNFCWDVIKALDKIEQKG